MENCGMPGAIARAFRAGWLSGRDCPDSQIRLPDERSAEADAVADEQPGNGVPACGCLHGRGVAGRSPAVGVAAHATA